MKDPRTERRGLNGGPPKAESGDGQRLLTSRDVAALLGVGGFAARLARTPVDLVTRLGMERSNAYYAAGCPLELCDHAAARDLWRVIYRDAIGSEEGLCL